MDLDGDGTNDIAAKLTFAVGEIIKCPSWQLKDLKDVVTTVKLGTQLCR
jgi:hypothetical protein